ncbi:hypothetical protein B566_EDAN016034 [Ephemera danica]|nr:hypothetical protein B566_EDAN016034 [Ephemera danica]
MEEPSGRVRRWSMRLMGMDCTVTYKRGPTNYVADALSRAPIQESPVEEARLVDELLPIEDFPEEARLKFDSKLDFNAKHHSCLRCAKPSPKQSNRVPRGPRVQVVNAYYTALWDPEDVPSNDVEWSEAQDDDPELTSDHSSEDEVELEDEGPLNLTLSKEKQTSRGVNSEGEDVAPESPKALPVQ